jgi:hypothetical protein
MCKFLRAKRLEISNAHGGEMPNLAATTRTLRCRALTLSVCALVPSALLAQSNETRPVRQAPSEPFANVQMMGSTTRAQSPWRARFVPRTAFMLDGWSVQVDSVAGEVLHASAGWFRPAGVNVLADIRIPVTRGVLGQPSISTRPRLDVVLSHIGQSGAVLPTEQAERVAVQTQLRQIIEAGALFESEPVGGRSVRRTQLEDGNGDIALSISAERHSRTVRDTTVSGRQVFVVRDSTLITLDHAVRLPSSYHNTLSRTRERARGTIVGTRLVDAQTHRAFVMYDTVVMKGTIESDDGLGGRFTSPLFITSTRRSTFHDAFWGKTVSREPFDIVRYTATPRQEARRPVGRDSLLALLERAPGLRTRDSLRAVILAVPEQRGMIDATLWRKVRTRSLAVGDTASIVARLMEGLQHGGLTMSVADYQLLRVPLASALAAFRMGVSTEWLVLEVMDRLMSRPPATAAAGAAPICAPEACAAMRADARSKVLKLQAVGLVAGMVTLPRVWTDSVLRYAESNPFLATRAKWFAQGTSSTAAASAKAAIPATSAPYESWRHWLAGRDSGYMQSLRADTAQFRMSQRMESGRPLHVSPIAAAAVQFAQVRTGANYVAAFRRYRDTTQSDSARALFTSLLITMNEPIYTDAQLTALLLGPKGPERDAALLQLRATMGSTMGTTLGGGRKGMAVASDSLASVIGRHVVNMMLADSVISRANWVPPQGIARSASNSVDSMPRYVHMDEYPEVVRAHAAALGFAPVARGWQMRPGDAGRSITFGPVLHRGPFVQVSVTHSTLYSRGTDRSGGFASGTILLLVEGPNGWTIVDEAGWIS